MSDTTIDEIYVKHLEVKGFPQDWEQAKSALYDLILKEVVGGENEHHKDMPVPDPDPFALPSDHQNQLRRYQIKKLKELFGNE